MTSDIQNCSERTPPRRQQGPVAALVQATVLTPYVAMTADYRALLSRRAQQQWRSVNSTALGEIDRIRAGAGSTADVLERLARAGALWGIDRVRRVLDRQAQTSPTAHSCDDDGRDVRSVLVADQRPVERLRTLHELRRDPRTCVAGDALDVAEALALTMFEQPDVLVIDELLDTLSGGIDTMSALDVVDALGTYAPDTRCIVLVDKHDHRVRAGRVDLVRYSRSAPDRRALVDLIVTSAAN